MLTGGTECASMATPSKGSLLLTTHCSGEKVSAISCMSICGILDVKMVTKTSSGDTFYKFVQTHLIPHLMPFKGINRH